jgi:hypothetical protein
MIEGGCHCGQLRYRVDDEEFIDAGYCHCDICRQTTGAPVLAWATFPFGSFSYTEGQPSIYQSSDWGQREFCGTCGTQVCYREVDDPARIDVNVGSLDDPEMFEPEYHLYTAQQLEWFEVDDDLQRYEGAGPDGNGGADGDDEPGEGDDETLIRGD